MELKDFISQTLIEIDNGLQEVQGKTSRDCYVSHGGEKGGVAFSLAVTVSDESTEQSGLGGKASIRVLKADMSKESSKKSSAEYVSRIDFTIGFPERRS